MTKLKAYAATFGAGYLGASLLEAFRQGRVPTSLQPVNDAAAVIPTNHVKRFLFLTSPIVLSGLSFIAVSRIWQASSALIAVTSANQVMGRVVGWAGIATSGIFTGAALRYYCLPNSTSVTSMSDVIALPQAMASNWTILKDACVTLVTFALLGGSWRHLVPSSVLYRGSFANTRLMSLLSQKTLALGKGSSKDVVATIGSYSGCHSCGARRGPFVADLSPPTEVVMQQRVTRYFQNPSQDYIPQCVPCSSKQASALRRWQEQPWYERQLMGHSAIQTHFSSFRLHDLTGVALGLVITPLIYDRMK